MKILLSTVLSLLLSVSLASGEVLFQDNFNSQSDWQPRPATGDVSPAGVTSSCDYAGVGAACGTTPTGWSGFKTSGWWWGPTYQDTIRITNQADRNGAGKAFIFYNEANAGGGGDNWGADGMLTKWFDQDYQELYARIYMRTQADWHWDAVNDMYIKMFRVGHFDGTGSFFTFFSGGYTAPLLLWDFKHSNSYGVRTSSSFRGDPQGTRYMMDGDGGSDALLIAGDSTTEPTGTGMPADTNWHRLDFRLKMNTYNSGSSTWNADGIYEMYYDGELKQARTNLLWKSTGSDPAIGWNMFAIGGNAYNMWTAQGNFGEQWYAIDDVVVSTTAIPADYVIGGGTPGPTTSTPRVYCPIRAAVR